MEEKILPKHIAIIMDGNRRWAKDRGLETRQGHKEGAETLKKIAKYANKIGIEYLTVYAFSTENWSRPKDEVGALMKLLRNYMKNCMKTADKNHMRVRVIGDISRLEPDLQESIHFLPYSTSYSGHF